MNSAVRVPCRRDASTARLARSMASAIWPAANAIAASCASQVSCRRTSPSALDRASASSRRARAACKSPALRRRAPGDQERVGQPLRAATRAQHRKCFVEVLLGFRDVPIAAGRLPRLHQRLPQQDRLAANLSHQLDGTEVVRKTVSGRRCRKSHPSPRRMRASTEGGVASSTNVRASSNQRRCSCTSDSSRHSQSV